MVIKYSQVNETTYLLSAIPYPYFDKINVITECCDPNCIYARSTSRLREKFEEKIHCFIGQKKNIKILFYASYLLAQELRIIALLSDKISEIHITDFAYKYWSDDPDNIFNQAFTQLIDIITRNGLNIPIYLHKDPMNLCTNKTYHRLFDVICGIDIDYVDSDRDHRLIMKDIAKNSLRLDGMLFNSRHYLDQVDISSYQIDNYGNVSLVETNDYVKNKYYKIYILEEFFDKAYNFLLFLFLVVIHFSIQLADKITLCGLLYIFTTIFMRCIQRRKNNYRRKIEKLENIIKVPENKINNCQCLAKHNTATPS